MPPSSNSKPRRDAEPTPPPARRSASSSTSRAAAPRTQDLSAPRRASSQGAPKKPVDPGVKRRAKKKTQARQRGFLVFMVAAGVSVMVAGAAAGVWTELSTTRARVAQKRATLADLSAQLKVGQNRLRALSSPSGKERVLVENGFIRSGERLLLFPKNASKPKKQ